MTNIFSRAAKAVWDSYENSATESITIEELAREFYSGNDLDTTGIITSGVRVNEKTAMHLGVVWSCVSLIARALASSPVHIYKGKKDSAKRELYDEYPLRKLLCESPNKQVTAITFWKYLAQSKLLQGNAFAAIQRDSFGQVTELIQFDPRNVTAYQAWELGLTDKGYEPFDLLYYLNWPNGVTELRSAEDMLHVPNLGWDGKLGLSTITHASRSLGLATAAEVSSSSFFNNSMQVNAVISYPNKLSAEMEEKVKALYKRRHQGVRNAYIPPVLSEGGKITPITINARDSQLIESRTFSVIDLCRFFGVLPVMIGETTKTTSWGSGVEQMGRWFSIYTMSEHYAAFGQEIDRKLMPKRGPGAGNLFCEFDSTKLTRGDFESRAKYFGVARGSLQQPAWLTPNEIRASEGYPPIENGDELLVPTEAVEENSPETDSQNLGEEDNGI